jgi:diguanylate cyclase (GGDEF)-like protein/PAS domain S-box-containing protein
MTGPGADDELEALLEFLYLAPIGIAQLAPDGTIELANPLVTQLLMPISPSGLSNLFDALSTYAPDLRSRVAAFDRPTGRVFEDLRVPIVPPHAPVAGVTPPAMLSVTVVKPRPDRMMALVRDITEIAAKERALHEKTQRLQSIVDGVRDYAIYTVDRRGTIDGWSRSAERVTGFAEADALGRPFWELFPDEEDAARTAAEEMQQAAAAGWCETEALARKATGERYWADSVTSVVLDEEGRPAGYTRITRDTTERKLREDELKRFASTDYLTGALNRRAFFEAAEAELRRWRRYRGDLSVVVLDADRFKLVNDTHGHAAGDEVLKHLAEVAGELARETDLVARFGGEEFVVLLPHTPLEGARVFGERLRAAVEARPARTSAGDLAVTVSVGVASMRDEDVDVAAMIDRADHALYAAKQNGRNRVEAAEG